MNNSKNQNNKILIVEDDEMVSFTILVQLEGAGYNIKTAKNGEEAIKVLNEIKDINLVITDIRMPALDGIELCRYIRKQEEYKYLPVLILTASSDSLTKYQGFTAGTDDYLTKPFDPIELLLRIQALLRRNERLQENSLPREEKTIEHDSREFVNSQIDINGKEVNFTNTEFDLFYYLYNNFNRYITSEELLHKVMEYPSRTGNPEIIRTHIRNIRAKIELDPHNPEIIKTIPRRGYFLDKSKIN